LTNVVFLENKVSKIKGFLFDGYLTNVVFFLTLQNHFFMELADFFSNSSKPIGCFYKHTVNLNPITSDGFPIQRQRCWDLERKISFVTAFFDYPQFTPPLWLFHRNGTNYEVLDGANRLQAIFDYRDNLFSVKGSSWRDLTPRERNRIDNKGISCFYAVSDDISNPLEVDAAMIQIYLSSNQPSLPQDPVHFNGLQEKLKSISLSLTKK
jgi:hypothetical protein